MRSFTPVIVVRLNNSCSCYWTRNLLKAPQNMQLLSKSLMTLILLQLFLKLSIEWVKDYYSFFHDQIAGCWMPLQLGFDYHQILVWPEDTHKMTLKTYNRHYEFLVIPFSLTNAPSTFEATMNDMLCRHLHCFVLVFFMIYWFTTLPMLIICYILAWF